MNSTLMNDIHSATQKKVYLYDQHKGRFVTRSIYAGIFLTLGTITAVTVAQYFSDIHPGIAKALYSLIFPLGLYMIIFMNAELATSNMMYLTTAAHRKWISYPKALQMILMCTLGNLVGSLLVVLFLSQSSAFLAADPNAYAVAAATTKLSKSSWVILIEAILANIFVNIAIVGQLRIKEEVGRIIFMTGVISAFSFLGYEHIIANFGLFPIAMIAGAHFGAGTMLNHCLWTLLGNYIGGGIIIGLVYSILNKEGIEYLD